MSLPSSLALTKLGREDLVRGDTVLFNELLDLMGNPRLVTIANKVKLALQACIEVHSSPDEAGQ